MAEEMKPVAGGGVTPTPGSVGVETQLPGQPTTVSGIAEATGGIGDGNQIETWIDDELYKFEGAESATLMQLMLKARRRKVTSPEVKHPIIDEERSTLVTTAAVSANTSAEAFKLPLSSDDMKIPRQCMTLSVKGVSGYDLSGNPTPGIDLTLYVVGKYDDGQPKCIAVNGPRTSAEAVPTVPAIPAGTEIVTMCPALYETQAVVPADSFNPQLMEQFLQKRGMTNIVSDYFDAQKKKIPFGKAAQAEQAIKNFLLRTNRTLWRSSLGKIVIDTPLGNQYLWTTKGVRWQFVREMKHTGKWTFETLVGLAKMFYCGEDKPKSGILLCGKNLLEQLQCIDYTNHKEINMFSMKNERMGWVVSAIHTAFGDIQLKHDPTLDNCGWANSGALIAEDRLVHYVYSAEHKDNDRVEGEEATRESTLVWDALCLKGTCHVWINGEGEDANSGSTVFEFWESTTAPTLSDIEDGVVYYFTNALELTSGTTTHYATADKTNAAAGELFKASIVEVKDGSDSYSPKEYIIKWEPYKGTMLLGD